ncbi:MAG: AraC family transcriptional regulator [Paenibacillaceae bacterium]|nr:AraC family transcriptional regulator [Paenibacillaceae bacterium]
MLNTLRRIRHRNRRSKRFYKLFLSYLLLVCFIVIVVGSVVYVNIIRAFQHEIEQAQLASVAQLRDTMDTRFHELQRTSLQIGSNPLLTPFMLTQSGYDAYQAVNELNKYRISNSFISNIVVFYPSEHANRLFSASGVYEEAEFFERMYAYENWSSEQLLKQIPAMTGPVIRPAETVYTLNRSQASTFVTYEYPLPAFSGKPYGIVMYLLDVQILHSMTENLVNRAGTYLYLLDKDNQTIYATNPDLPRQFTGTQKEPIMTRVINGVSYSVIRQPFLSNDWTLELMVPTSLFIEKVDRIRNVFTSILVLLIVIGGAASFILANSNYQELRKLVQLFSVNKETLNSRELPMDEITYLSNAIREMSGQENMMHQLKSRRGLIRENVLLSLFKNKPHKPDELLKTLELADIRFDYSHYVSVLLAIDNYSGFQKVYTASVQELLKFSILNAAEELAQEAGRGYGVSIVDDQGIALVINLQDPLSYREQLEVFATQLQTFFNSYYQFSLTICVGRVYAELDAIGLSYDEARRALHYRFVKGRNLILFYDELLSAGNEQVSSYPQELEDELIRNIRQGNAIEAEHQIHQLFASFQSFTQSPEAAQLASSGLLHALIKVSDELKVNRYTEAHSESEVLRASKTETMDELKDHMIQLCREICEHVLGRKESRNFKLRDEIIAFLHERYMDNTLSLEVIADQFGMSSSYLTRFVKDQTGHSLIRYLDQLRMAKAKELLLNGEENLMEITNEVGYVDVSNFIKKFKKMEGVTPEQYRKLRKNV